jgi:hypothetical protein
MGRRGLVWAVCVGFVAACSGGGGTAATSTTTSSTTPTTAPTTTTTTPEDAVRNAWDGYWSMVVRLSGAPDGDDPELSQRVAEPLLSALRDDFTTQKSKGQTVVTRPGAQYAHRLDAVSISDGKATLTGCKIDDSTTLGPSGEVVDDSVATSNIAAVFILDGAAWKAMDVRFTGMTTGISGCAHR